MWLQVGQLLSVGSFLDLEHLSLLEAHLVRHELVNRSDVVAVSGESLVLDISHFVQEHIFFFHLLHLPLDMDLSSLVQLTMVEAVDECGIRSLSSWATYLALPLAPQIVGILTSGAVSEQICLVFLVHVLVLGHLLNPAVVVRVVASSLNHVGLIGQVSQVYLRLSRDLWSSHDGLGHKGVLHSGVLVHLADDLHNLLLGHLKVRLLGSDERLDVLLTVDSVELLSTLGFGKALEDESLGLLVFDVRTGTGNLMPEGLGEVLDSATLGGILRLEEILH